MKNLSGSRTNRVCHIILILFWASTLFAAAARDANYPPHRQIAGRQDRKDIWQSGSGDLKETRSPA